jgi:hypothetical protein
MNFQRILPLVAALAAIGGAIYHGQASAQDRTVAAPVVASAPAPVAPGSTLPPSDRYAQN